VVRIRRVTDAEEKPERQEREQLENGVLPLSWRSGAGYLSSQTSCMRP
jgi:hypothetical protein